MRSSNRMALFDQAKHARASRSRPAPHPKRPLAQSLRTLRKCSDSIPWCVRESLRPPPPHQRPRADYCRRAAEHLPRGRFRRRVAENSGSQVAANGFVDPIPGAYRSSGERRHEGGRTERPANVLARRVYPHVVIPWRQPNAAGKRHRNGGKPGMCIVLKFADDRCRIQRRANPGTAIVNGQGELTILARSTATTGKMQNPLEAR